VLREALVDSPLNHGRFLHASGKGCLTVARRVPGVGPPGEWEQRSYPFEKMAELLPAYGGMDDVYISQNRFYGPRAVSKLAQLSAMYADLDHYKVPDLAGALPRGVLGLALEELERAGIPRPSLAVATGRGLALVWRHDPVSRAVLPKWKVCQDGIFRALEGLGADPSARDAARVLRLVGTRNSKSGAIVETIWEEPGGWLWDFGDLADEILPLSRGELEELRAQRREKRASAEGTRSAPERREDVAKRFTTSTLALGRLGDLQRLLGLRGWEKLPPGRRDAWMFAAGTSLAYLTEPQALGRELVLLGREHAGWGEAETRSRMSTVISRAHAASAGETAVEWNGQHRDPRYRLTNRKIIEDLGITPEEEKEMQVIISEDTKRQRDRERKGRERRARGAKTRGEYLARAREGRQHNRRQAQVLRTTQGLSYRQIGTKLGISHTHVKRLLDEGDGTSPSPYIWVGVTPHRVSDGGRVRSTP
jgi:hypothetical protein